MFVQLVGAGGESTAGLVGNAAWILATHPEIQQRVRRNPDLLEPFIEETLRYESPFRGHFRHVVKDTELAGVELLAGSHLMLLWGAANRDSLQFKRRASFGWIGQESRITCHLARDCISAWAPHWPAMEARIVLRCCLVRPLELN